MLINCTQKAIKALKLRSQLTERSESIVQGHPDDYTWYCNVMEIFIDTVDLIFVHKTTMLSFTLVIPHSMLPEIPLKETIAGKLIKTLEYYEVPQKSRDLFTSQAFNMIYARGDQNRSLLGIMRSMIYKYELKVNRDYIEDRPIDWQRYETLVNGTPYTAAGAHKGYGFPEDVFTEKFGGVLKYRSPRLS